MAAEKIFRRVFSDFKGLDLNSNVLIRQPDSAIDMVNLEVGDDFSLRMRDGCKVLGQPIRSLGITNYTVGGVEQLVCYGVEQRHTLPSSIFVPHLYRLVSANLTITRVGGSTSWNAYFYVDKDASQWRFDLSQGGVVIYTLLCGTGLEVSPVTLKTLELGITALANFNAALDWTWTASGTGFSLTVPVLSNPHPFPELRAVYFPSAVGGTRWRFLRETTAAPALVCDGNALNRVNYTISETIGLGTLPAATLNPRSPELGEQAALSVQAIPFQYWEPIPSHQIDSAAAYQTIVPSGPLSSTIVSKDYGQVNFAQARNLIYFSGSEKIGTNLISSTNTFSYLRVDLGTPQPINVFRGVHKYDGLFSYMTSNYYEPYVSTAAHAAAFPATWTLGTLYKYRILIRTKDNQGNVVVSASTLPFNFTVSNAAQGIQLTMQTRSGVSQFAGIIRSGIMDAAASTALPISLAPSSNDAPFRVGDRVSVLGPDPTVGFSWESRFGTVTAWSAAAGTVTVQMDAGNYTTVPVGARTVSGFVAANEAVVEVYRTKANGNIFYLAGQIPLFYEPTSPTTTFVDDVLDANLGRVYDGPVDDFGNPVLNLPMGIATSLAAHQGVIAHIGENGNLRWDDGDFIERWIPSRAELEIASNTPGDVAGLVSDQNAQLIAAKPNALIAVTGSLPENQANTNILVENFRGVGTQASLVPFLGKIFGCGANGPFTLEQGQLQIDFANRVQTAFQFGTGNKLGGVTSVGTTPIGVGIGANFRRSTVTVETPRHRVIITPPNVDYSFYYDYLYNVWGVFSGYIPSHGGTAYAGGFAFGSRFSTDDNIGAVFERTRRTGNDFYRFFNDNCAGVEVKLTMGFDDLDAPNVAKEWQWLRAYFAPVEKPNFAANPATAYYATTPLLVTYKNYRFDTSSTALQDTYPGDADSWECQSKVWRLRSELVNSLAVHFYIEATGSVNEPFILSGYDIMVAPSTKADSISR